MKKIVLSILSIVPTVFIAVPVLAADIMVPAAMQRCNTNDDCAMISNTCSDSCGSAPVNKASLSAIQQQYATRCGKTLESQPKCTMNPPMNSACINSRCTVDYAFANHAGPADYKSGAYPVPEAPVQSKVDPAKAPANDRHGFTAYDMNDKNVKEDTLGQLKETVYVPPQAPVQGGNYVAVGTPQPAPAPVAAPTPTTTPAPAPVVTTPPAPAPAPVAEPQANADPYATPRAPSAPATYVPAKPEFAPPAEPQIVADPSVPATTVHATPPKLPPMPPQPAPIVASDLKEQRLAPPAGETVHAGPNDPGAVPPNAELLAPIPQALGEEAGNSKSFSAEKKKSDIDLN